MPVLSPSRAAHNECPEAGFRFSGIATIDSFARARWSYCQTRVAPWHEPPQAKFRVPGSRQSGTEHGRLSPAPARWPGSAFFQERVRSLTTIGALAHPSGARIFAMATAKRSHFDVALMSSLRPVGVRL